MLSLIKTVVWIVGSLAIAYFVIGFFGYEVNKEYFGDSKSQCQERLKECTGKVLHDGIDNIECDFKCADPKLFIQKK